MADVFYGEDGTEVHEITKRHVGLFRLTRTFDDQIDYIYTFNDLGQVTHIYEDYTGLSASVDLDIDYDSAGNRLSITTEIGTNKDYVTNYAYDDLNRLTSVEQTDQSGGNAVADKRFDVSYNALSQITQIDRFESLSASNPALRTAYGYDSANRLDEIDHLDVDSVGSTTLLHGYDFSYDDMDRYVSIDSSIDGLSSFTFDELSQLTDADHAVSRPDEEDTRHKERHKGRKTQRTRI